MLRRSPNYPCDAIAAPEHVPGSEAVSPTGTPVNTPIRLYAPSRVEPHLINPKAYYDAFEHFREHGASGAAQRDPAPTTEHPMHVHAAPGSTIHANGAPVPRQHQLNEADIPKWGQIMPEETKRERSARLKREKNRRNQAAFRDRCRVRPETTPPAACAFAVLDWG